MPLIEKSYKELKLNPFTMISDEWMLLTAGNKDDSFNTMTVSWGHLGAIWGHGKGKPTAIVYVRPQRYTKIFMEKETYFTLSVFPPEYKKTLGYLGTHSGKYENKVDKVGLTPIFCDGTTCFKEAKLVFVCKKLYASPLLEGGFLDKAIIADNYPEKDFHTAYIGEIIKVYENE